MKTPVSSAPGAPLRLNLLLPGTRLQLGALTIDPLARVLGAPIEQFLGPVVSGPESSRQGVGGQLYRVYPLEVVDGVGVTLPLGQAGELGVMNDRGFLKVTVPALLHAWLANLPATYGPAYEQNAAGGRVCSVWVRIQPGAGVSLPLGFLGYVAIEGRE